MGMARNGVQWSLDGVVFTEHMNKLSTIWTFASQVVISRWGMVGQCDYVGPLLCEFSGVHFLGAESWTQELVDGCEILQHLVTINYETQWKIGL